MLTRVSNLTSHQLADRIIATDLAIHRDSIGYFTRRAFSPQKQAENLRQLLGESGGAAQNG